MKNRVRITGALRSSSRRQGIAALLALLASAGCAGTAEPALPEAERPPPLGAVRVRLAFPAEVDLDLYVTGPSQETVYFANRMAADGGALDVDRRCGSPGPRLETVLFPEAVPGVYRVGLDFPERCQGGADRVPYALDWEGPGLGLQQQRGEIRFGQLEVRVLEFSVGAEASPPPAAPSLHE